MNEQLQAGDWVEVRAPREIADTLDANGTLDGLPFMPEMIEYCGRRFRVHRRVEKTCVEVTSGRYDFREFPQNDAVLLDGLRCSGSDHGGCQRVCSLFWKTAWLRRVSDDRSEAVADETGGRGPWPKLQTLAGSGRYFCQSTEPRQSYTVHAASTPSIEVLLRCPLRRG